MPRKRNVHKISSQTVKRSHDLAKTKQKKTSKVSKKLSKKSKTKESLERNFESDLLLEMKEKGYNGKQFVDHLKACVEDRLNKRGKPPRMRNKVGPNDANDAYPQIAPGDIKGEIREDAYLVQIEEFCEALNINKLH